jgi:hypothetical protein
VNLLLLAVLVQANVYFVEDSLIQNRAELLDVSGRKVQDLKPGPDDVSRLAPGVYFMREQPQAASRKSHAVRKVVIAQ